VPDTIAALALFSVPGTITAHALVGVPDAITAFPNLSRVLVTAALRSGADFAPAAAAALPGAELAISDNQFSVL
jgi:hypothetical protein